MLLRSSKKIFDFFQKKKHRRGVTAACGGIGRTSCRRDAPVRSVHEPRYKKEHFFRLLWPIEWAQSEKKRTIINIYFLYIPLQFLASNPAPVFHPAIVRLFTHDGGSVCSTSCCRLAQRSKFQIFHSFSGGDRKRRINPELLIRRIVETRVLFS